MPESNAARNSGWQLAKEEKTQRPVYLRLAVSARLRLQRASQKRVARGVKDMAPADGGPTHSIPELANYLVNGRRTTAKKRGLSRIGWPITWPTTSTCSNWSRGILFASSKPGRGVQAARRGVRRARPAVAGPWPIVRAGNEIHLRLHSLAGRGSRGAPQRCRDHRQWPQLWHSRLECRQTRGSLVLDRSDFRCRTPMRNETTSSPRKKSNPTHAVLSDPTGVGQSIAISPGRPKISF